MQPANLDTQPAHEVCFIKKNLYIVRNGFHTIPHLFIPISPIFLIYIPFYTTSLSFRSFSLCRKKNFRTFVAHNTIINLMKKIILLFSALIMSLSGKAEMSDYQNWMSQLDDNAFICQLSIPGAHDACASSFSFPSSIAAAVSGKVQTKSVEQMLPLGVRAFDLRPDVN